MSNHLLLILLLFSATLQAQNTPFSCGTVDQGNQGLLANKPLQLTSRSLPTMQARASVDTTTTYTIPVIFVIYHLGEPIGTGSNLADELLYAQIDQLNRTFAAEKPTYIGVDSKIRFALARRSPTCDQSTGIVRVDARSVANYQQQGLDVNDRLKDIRLQGLLPDYAGTGNDRFVVVRVVHRVSGAGAWTTTGGIYIPTYSINTATSTVLTHEMGHVLNLAHTFLGTDQYGNCPPNNDPDNDGDHVADTDPHRFYEPYNACDLASQQQINACTGRPFGLIGRNFMSYGCDTRLFTQGQVLRMRSYLQSDHSGLVDSPYLSSPSATDFVVTACRPASVSAINPHAEGVWRVTFGQIDYYTYVNSYNNGINYYDYSCTKRTRVTPSGSYRLDVFGNGRYRRAYMDFNNDGSFNEDNELVLRQETAGVSTSSAVIKIPTTAVTNHFLRLRVLVDNGNSAPNACNLPGSANGSGEAEDYGVYIVGNLDCIELTTLKAGSWLDPSVWSCGRVPTSADQVRLLHEVRLTAGQQGKANRLVYGPTGKLQMDAGAQLVLTQP